MPEYKLYYFNAMGRAETARMMFALTGTKYEDIRLTGEEWQAMKPNMPMGVLPVLAIDNKRLGQSSAINSYLARELGLYGKDSMHTARIDEIVNCLSDLAQDLYKVLFPKTEEEKAAQMKEFEEKTFPVWMERFDQILKNYNQQYGDDAQVTLAEISAFNAVFVIKKATSVDKLSSRLEAFVDKVEANENVKQWLAKRPVTNF